MKQNRIIFPETFLWGASTSAFQIEGSVNQDNKGHSIWDVFTHKKGKIIDNSNGDTAIDHYNRYVSDIKLMKKIGIQTYRFSISWTRIFPVGKGQLNQKGLDFYERLVDELLKFRIIPFITLFHWDLPEELQKKGGWVNKDTILYFSDYVYSVVKKLADRVDYWITLNEPSVFTAEGYITGRHAPGKKNIFQAVKVIHNLLLGHAEAYNTIKSISDKLKVGFANHFIPVYIRTNKDIKLTNKYNALINRLFIDPILLGFYPREIENFIYLFNRNIDTNDLKKIHKTFDFLGVNYYTRKIIKKSLFFLKWFSADKRKKNDSEYTDMGWEVYPRGLFDILKWIKDEYNNIPLFITENGAAYNDILENGEIYDYKRIEYIKSHLLMIHKAVEYGCNVNGYFVWSIFDNFEWAYGLTKRFGLIYVDYENQKRILKESSKWYGNLCRKNQLFIS